MITIIKRHGFGTARTHFTKIKRQSVNSISHLTLSELICVRNKYIQNKHEDNKSEALTDKLYDGWRRWRRRNAREVTAVAGGRSGGETQPLSVTQNK